MRQHWLLSYYSPSVSLAFIRIFFILKQKTNEIIFFNKRRPAKHSNSFVTQNRLADCTSLSVTSVNFHIHFQEPCPRQDAVPVITLGCPLMISKFPTKSRQKTNGSPIINILCAWFAKMWPLTWYVQSMIESIKREACFRDLNKWLLTKFVRTKA